MVVMVAARAAATPTAAASAVAAVPTVPEARFYTILIHISWGLTEITRELQVMSYRIM